MKPTRRGVLGAAVTALLSTLVYLGPRVPSTAAGAGTSGFTASKALTRIHSIQGQDQVIDSRTVTLAVSQTQNLRGNQEVDVSWTGAHPTGGLVADQNSADAAKQEYPMVLLECRGVDASTPAAGQEQLDPSRCWTSATSERYQDTFGSDAPWLHDRYATAAQRALSFGMPNDLSTRNPNCATNTPPINYWVPFVAADGTVFHGSCDGMPPEASNLGGLNLPSNETYGVSARDGVGQAKFDVWTTDQNASLGCTNGVACALVAVPIMGISCDVAAGLPPAQQPPTGTVGDTLASTISGCVSTGFYVPGDGINSSQNADTAVTGSLWWAASNWRNRITVPLTFAPPANVCSLTAKTQNEIDVYGSELMSEASTAWAPHFCLPSPSNSAPFNFKHVRVPEPEARQVLTAALGSPQAAGQTVAAFTSDVPPNGYPSPVVNAPVAVTGFAVSFVIDDPAGHAVTNLLLTPRLLAKLLSESYPTILQVQANHPGDATHPQARPFLHNPLQIVLDPEFQALNPGIPTGISSAGLGPSAGTLLMLSSDSDVVRALTSYINEDTEARAWLDGAPDPWGMVVNPAYQKISLPVDSWPQLDTFEPPGMVNNDCLKAGGNPYLPLVASPKQRLDIIAIDMQFALAQSQVVCFQPIPGSLAGAKLVALGRQSPGHRFMLAITSLGEARFAQLDTAALQTQVSASAADKFTSPAGRTFVAPTIDALRAAAQTLKPDTTSGTWPVDYHVLRTSPAGANAYPGTMVVYAAVPTSGLPPADAADYVRLLKFAAGDGQGSTQLAAGYLPMTAANGLGSFATFTLAAADAVSAQKGDVPSVVPASAPSPSPSPSPSAAPSPSATAPVDATSTPSSDPGTGAVGAGASPGAVASPTPGASPAASALPSGGGSPAAGPAGDPGGSAPRVAASRGFATKPLAQTHAATALQPALAPVRSGGGANQPLAIVGKTVGVVVGWAGAFEWYLVAAALLGALGAAVTYYTGRRQAR